MTTTDPDRMPTLKLFGREYPLPRSRMLRVVVGVVLVLCGTVGFLPVVGFWMIPLGMVVLGHDFPAVRRFNRRIGDWFRRKFNRKR